MSLQNIPNWDDLEESLIFLKNKNDTVNENKLFDQFCNLKDFVEAKITNDEFKNVLAHEKWCEYFKTLNNIDQHSEFYIIATYFFSIPFHNANVERVFSLIESQWTDERNRLKVETVQFYKFILENPNILNKIASNSKYCAKVSGSSSDSDSSDVNCK